MSRFEIKDRAEAGAESYAEKIDEVEKRSEIERLLDKILGM